MSPATPLQGCRVLLVEDDYLLAMDACYWLEEAGAEIVGPAATPEEACALLEVGGRVDKAVIDVNLGQGPSFAVASRLQERRVPFLFATGYAREVIPTRFDAVPRVAKPFTGHALITAVRAL